MRTIDSGFVEDGEPFSRGVLELGLPNVVRFDHVRFKIATSCRCRADLKCSGRQLCFLRSPSV